MGKEVGKPLTRVKITGGGGGGILDESHLRLMPSASKASTPNWTVVDGLGLAQALEIGAPAAERGDVARLARGVALAQKAQHARAVGQGDSAEAEWCGDLAHERPDLVGRQAPDL